VRLLVVVTSGDTFVTHRCLHDLPSGPNRSTFRSEMWLLCVVVAVGTSGAKILLARCWLVGVAKDLRSVVPVPLMTTVYQREAH
jgi:hypothetical protein